LGRINLFCQEQGLGQTRIYNKMMQKRSFADSQNDVSRSNHISAQDLGKMKIDLILRPAFFEAASADSVADLHFVITHIRSSFLLLRSGLGGGTGFCLQSSLR
jgi:hypothetical protein